MKLVAAKCPSCGANIDVDKNSDKTICEYCGSKIIVEDAIAKYKLEISGKVEVSNLTNSIKLVKLGDKAVKDNLFKEALEKYNRAFELDPDNTYIEFMIHFCKMNIAQYDLSYVTKAGNKLLNLDACYNSKYEEISDVSSAVNLYIEFVYQYCLTWKRNKYASLAKLLEVINYWKEVLRIFEKINSNLDINKGIKIKLLVYINDLIFLLIQRYRYEGSIFTSYRVKEGYDLLLQKKEHYYKVLKEISPENAKSFEYELNNGFNILTGINYKILIIIGFFMFIMIVAFLASIGEA